MTAPAGVLPVDKPEGPTSHDVVAMARRALRTRRIGHTGTLDPFASGLLLLCLGPATRLAEYLTGLPKRYDATVRLGAATDTDDLTGAVLSREEGWRGLSDAAIREALARQVGTILQTPPIYSAKKVAGERMYEAARRGERPEIAPVEVTIHSIEVRGIALPDVEIVVDCSSGTYIRAIARDLGAALGVGGHLARLRRTRVGTHEVSGALPVDRLDDPGAVGDAMIRPEDAVSHFPRVTLDTDEARKVANGGAVPAPGEGTEGETVALLAPDGDLLAVAERAGGLLRPRKVFT